MAATRKQKINDKKPKKMSGGVQKVFVTKLKGNEEAVRPISEINEQASERNAYFTVKAQIISTKYNVYQVKNLFSFSMRKNNLRHVQNATVE